MTSLSVFESDDGYLVVDSRLIAERLNIQHESLVRTINKYKRKLEAKFGLLRPQIGTVTNSVGAVNEVQYFWLTESQASTLMTLSRNTDEVVDLKFELVEAFEKLKEIIKSRRAKQFSKKLQDATLKIYTLDVPVKWSTRGRVFQQDFYEAVYKIKGKPPCDNPNQHPVWMAQVTIDLIYRRLQPGLWDELSRKIQSPMESVNFVVTSSCLTI